MENILIQSQEIQKKVLDITKQFNALYNEQNEQQVLFVPILQGATTFFQDICRGITFNPYIDYVGVSSYKGERQGEFHLYKMVDPSLIRGRVIWLFDDIADSGKTLDFLAQMLMQYGAKEVKTCVFLKKSKCPYPVDLHAFDMGNEWVWGYGMDDVHGRGRTIKHILYDESKS